MKLGIIGLPQSGKSTIFDALTGARGEEKNRKQTRSDNRIGTLRVIDERVDFLSNIHKPQKTTHAQVEYLLPSEILHGTSPKAESAVWNQVRVCDALIHVLRHFQAPGGVKPSCETDFWQLEEEMILHDLGVVERRLERIELDGKRGNKPNEEEYTLLKTCRGLLDDGRSIRIRPEQASAPVLKGFTFLSAKPQLVIINNDDEDESAPEWNRKPDGVEMLIVRGRLEKDIALMTPEEAEEFLVAYHIENSALDRVIKSSYELLNLISFFTVLNEEVRAWTIREGTPAIEAAGTVHSDMQKGFIRAEVLSFEDLKKYGSYQEAKKVGRVRLEGKTYTVQDGDIVNFRFNV